MDKLSLTVLLYGSPAGLLSDIQSASMPQGVTLTVRTIDDDIRADELDTVLITDDNALATKVLSEGFERLELVYIGNASNVVDSSGLLPERLLCVWDAQTFENHGKELVERLATQLKDRYDAWLYKNWLMSLIDSLPDLVWYKEKSGLHNLVNLEFCKTVRRTREDCKDKGHCYIWNAPPESEYQCAETDNAVMSGGITVVADEKVETDKGMRQFRTYKSPVYDREGAIMGTVGLAHDVTDFTNMGIELQILTDNLPFPVAIANTNDRLVSSNVRFRSSLGMTEDEVKGLDYVSWKDDLATIAHTRLNADGERIEVEDLVVPYDEETHYYELTEPDIIDYFGNVSGHFCIFRDVTKDRAYEQQTLEYANTDPLTGLANRRYFYSYLLMHTGEPTTLFNIDLDNFKHVNDTYGHHMGDKVLVHIARLFEQEVPEGVIARQGGDEFACFIPRELDDDEIATYTNRIVNRIEKEFAHLGVGLGCSVGTARTDALDENPDAFLRTADKRMYEIKALRHKNQPR